MSSRKEHIDLANWEILLIALHRVGGDHQMVDVETAYIEAHRLAPRRFSWRTREIPEIKKLSKALRDADAKGNRYMTGSGNRRQLTAVGLEWIEAHSEEVKLLNDPRTLLGQARSTVGHIMLKRLLKSQEYKAWEADQSVTVERWRLANLFKCSPDSPVETWHSRLEQTGVAAHAEGRADVRAFLDQIREAIENE